jgi:cobalt-zinc-cadmium resistance protein CzcA
MTEAIKRAAMGRLRPILMTATVASLGLLPMAIGHGAGAEVQRPLATVVIGGLMTAVMLQLLVLPSIYPWFDPARPEDDFAPEDDAPPPSGDDHHGHV